jgi:Zn-dependent protease with chaperone function
LPATAFLLLMAAGLLVFTSPPGDVAPSARDTKVRRFPRRSRPHDPPDPIAVAVVEDDEPNGEPLWLLAFSSFVVIASGLLFIFYTDIPVSALV